MNNRNHYWDEALSSSIENNEAWHLFQQLTKEQRIAIADDMEHAREHFSMAFYQPPDSEYYDRITDEWKKKYDDLKKEYDKYISNAERAVKQALRQYPDSNISIGEHGEVFRYDGRITQIQ